MERNHDLFGINLKRIRKQQKLSRQKLAEMSKVSEWTIMNIERCQVGAGLYTALQICDALEININELIGDVK